MTYVGSVGQACKLKTHQLDLRLLALLLVETTNASTVFKSGSGMRSMSLLFSDERSCSLPAEVLRRIRMRIMLKGTWHLLKVTFVRWLESHIFRYALITRKRFIVVSVVWSLALKPALRSQCSRQSHLERLNVGRFLSSFDIVRLIRIALAPKT